MNQSQGNSDSGQTNTVTVKRSLDFSNEAAAAEDEAATTAAPLSPLQQYKEGKELSLEQGKWLQQLVDRVENEFKSMPDEEFCRQLEVAKKHIHLKEHEAYVRAKECFSEEDWHFADPEGDECEDLKGFKVWLLMKDLQFETNATAAEAEAPAPAMTSPTIEDEATRQTQADSLELPDEAMAPELEPELPEPELLEHPQSRDAATLAEHQQQAQAEAKPSEPEALQQMQQQAPNTVELEMAKAETVGMAEVAPEQKPKGEAGLSPADDKESNSKGEKAKEEPTTAVAPPPEVQPQQQAAAEVPEAKVQPQDPLHLQTAAAAKAAEPEIHPQPQSQPGGPKVDPPQAGEAAVHPQQQAAAAAKAAAPEIHPQPQSQPGGPKVDPPQAGEAAVHPQPGQPESSAEEEERTFDDLLDSEIERAGSSSQGRRPRGQLSLSLSLSINHCHCLPAKLPVKLCKQYQHQHQHCLQNRLRPWAPSISSCISTRGRRKNPKMSPSLQRHQKQKQCLLRLFQARLRLRLRLRAQTTAPQPRQQHSPSNHPGSGSPRLDPAATG